MKIGPIIFSNKIAISGIILTFFQIALGISTSLCQVQSYDDSLNFAKSQLDQGKISGALDLLQSLEKTHAGEENFIRVKGKALYWSKDFEATKNYFRQNLKDYPEHYWAKLDFARILYELNEWNESQKILEACLEINSLEPETNQKLAALNYWKGGSPKRSYSHLAKILTPYPENELANALKEEIKTLTSPYLGISAGFHTDSQPLQYLRFLASGNFY